METNTTERGDKRICLDSFMYIIKTEAKSKDAISWRCVKRQVQLRVPLC